MQKGVSTSPEYEFMKPACDFNLTNVSEQTHLRSTDPWGEGFGGLLCAWAAGLGSEMVNEMGNEIFDGHS